MRVIHVRADRICPFCRSTFCSESIVRCPSCGTAHHRSCWQRHHRCSVYGCRASSPPTNPIPFGLAAAVFLLLLMVILIFAAVSFSAAAFEFGIHAGYQSLHGIGLPALLLTILLLCGFYTFYIDTVRE